MATDVFSRTTDQFAGSFSADNASITFPALRDSLGRAAGAETGLLLQQMQMQYMQQITRLYELTSNAIYYVGGRTNGGSTLNRVVGPRKLAKEFYKTYGNVCHARTNALRFTAQSGCAGGDLQFQNAAFDSLFNVITQLSLSVGAQDMMINEALQVMFSSLQYN